MGNRRLSSRINWIAKRERAWVDSFYFLKQSLDLLKGAQFINLQFPYPANQIESAPYKRKKREETMYPQKPLTIRGSLFILQQHDLDADQSNGLEVEFERVAIQKHNWAGFKTVIPSLVKHLLYEDLTGLVERPGVEAKFVMCCMLEVEHDISIRRARLKK